VPTERKKLLLRLDPGVHDALSRWANDELRSTNAQIEFLLRRALGDAGRMPDNVGRIRRPGRPPADPGMTAPADPVIRQSDPPLRPDTEPTPPDRTAADHTGPGSTDHTGQTNANPEEP